jgi:CNP1-like family
MIKTLRAPWALAWGMALFASAAGAQNTLDNPDWVEEKAPPPPAFSKTELIPIVMPPYVTIKVGVDPLTVRTGGDGIVRYVVVMTNATGTVNAFYEGIRCLTDEVKTYARMGSSGEWSQVADPQWKHVNDNQAFRHSHAISRQGACHARLALSAPEIVKALKEQEVAYKRYQPKLN